MRIDPNGVAANAGIRQGDLIQEINRRPVRSVLDFTAATATVRHASSARTCEATRSSHLFDLASRFLRL